MNKHFIRTADQETANILKSIGYEPSVKWYRTRSKAKLDYDIFIKYNIYAYLYNFCET